jgi:TM2 domain-containing membrane protein YozV
VFCRTCGKEIPNFATVCTACGVPTGVLAQQPPQQLQQHFHPATNQPVVFDPNAKSKMAAGLLGVFLGAWGVHRFYLGHVGIGIAQIAVTLVTCGVGGLWGFIEGILVLTGTINTDAEGRPLRD